MKLVIIKFVTKSLKVDTEAFNLSRKIKNLEPDELPLGRPLLSHVPGTIPNTYSVLRFHLCASVAT